MKANDYQIGGNHYKKYDYEHWDWATDTNQPLLIGCATKYIARWCDKNGVQDLRKAAHYLSKAQERGVTFSHWALKLLLISTNDNRNSKSNLEFKRQLCPDDAEVIDAIIENDFELAKELIAKLIKEAEAHEINKQYESQNNLYTRG